MKKSFDLCNPCHRKLIFDLVMRKFSYSEDDIHLLVSQAVGEAGTFFTYKCDRDCDWYERFEIEAYFVEEFKSLSRGLLEKRPKKSDWTQESTHRMIHSCGFLFQEEKVVTYYR